MARLSYATETPLQDLIRQAGLPENTPAANAFRMFAHAPAVGAATLRLVFALLIETALDPVLREVVILRVSQQCECQYAWAQHVAIARRAGVEEAHIAALEQGEAPQSLFDQRACAAFALADDILKNCRASDRAFTVVLNLFSPREIVELLLLIGYFRMISGVMTTLDVDVEFPFGAEILASLSNGQ
jgi:AhpD family alkylhydroperoxidase